MKKIMKNVLLTLLILTLGASTALLAYLHFFAPDNLSGEWTGTLDMTPRATATALDWLQEVEGVSISLEDLQTYLQDLVIETDLYLEQTHSAAGTFHCRVLPESYEACRTAAYEGFAAAFQDILALRLHMAGYTGGTDPGSLEALTTQALGMSAIDYLMEYAPALLPSIEELQAQYDGSGIYESTDGTLIRQFSSGHNGSAIAEYYIWKGDTLVLTGSASDSSPDFSSVIYPVIYTRKQVPDQSE